MKKILSLCMTSVAGLLTASDHADAPRTPERDDIMQIVEQVNNPMLEEIYRRREKKQQ